MKKLLPFFKSKFKNPKVKVITIIILILIIVTMIFGLFKYILLLLTLAIFVLVSRDGKMDNEKILSPWAKEERDKKYNEILNKKEIIEKHIETNQNDLNAKLQLEEVKKDIEEFEKKYNL